MASTFNESHINLFINNCIKMKIKKGENKTQCEYGKWSGRTPRCQEIYCSFPGIIDIYIGMVTRTPRCQEIYCSFPGKVDIYIGMVSRTPRCQKLYCSFPGIVDIYIHWHGQQNS